jgi:hypothetical protein
MQTVNFVSYIKTNGHISDGEAIESTKFSEILLQELCFPPLRKAINITKVLLYMFVMDEAFLHWDFFKPFI